MTVIKTDFLIIGAGIIGLTMAMNLRQSYPHKEIVIVEKEEDVALHSSGRNSGVLHAGFYYTADSLKARFTKEGCLFWQKYCLERGLPLNKCGKVVVARGENELEDLYELKKRAEKSGVEIYLIDDKELQDVEPYAKTYIKALWSPNTATIEPTQLCKAIKEKLIKQEIRFFFSTPYRKRIEEDLILAGNKLFKAEKIINAAGLYADRIAKDFGSGQKYTILPFKGIYLEFKSHERPVKRNIYPVPDLNKPFLGVHFTVKVNGTLKIGPTAIPALWRQQYEGLRGFSLRELCETGWWNLSLLVTNKSGFRSLAIDEVKKYSKEHLRNAASALIKGNVEMSKFSRWGKPGIRAQLLNKETMTLEMDFVVDKKDNSVHILNSVSPAFTASYPFTRWIVENYL